VTRRFLSTVVWLAAGHAVIGLLFWVFLQVPESNVLMLTASLLTIAAMVCLLGCVEAFGMTRAQLETRLLPAVGLAVRRAPLVVAPLALFALIWWLTAIAGDWHSGHSGEIDAWIIARTGWTRTTGLHAALEWLLAFVRYGIGLSMAVSLFAASVVHGVRAVGRAVWLRRAFGWRQLLVTAAGVFVGVWLPWQVVYWRPAFLPPTWVEPAFAAAKLAVLFLVFGVAWTVILWTAAREARREKGRSRS
jgi:hypothetical protein